MSSKEKTTKRTAEIVSSESRSVATRETHPVGSTLYSETLKTALETHASSLNTHADRLSGLIHSEVWSLEQEYAEAESPDEMNRKLSEQQRDTVLQLGHQYLETVKVAIGLRGLQLKMERGD